MYLSTVKNSDRMKKVFYKMISMASWRLILVIRLLTVCKQIRDTTGTEALKSGFKKPPDSTLLQNV